MVQIRHLQNNPNGANVQAVLLFTLPMKRTPIRLYLLVTTMVATMVATRFATMVVHVHPKNPVCSIFF